MSASEKLAEYLAKQYSCSNSNKSLGTDRLQYLKDLRIKENSFQERHSGRRLSSALESLNRLTSLLASDVDLSKTTSTELRGKAVIESKDSASVNRCLDRKIGSPLDVERLANSDESIHFSTTFRKNQYKTLQRSRSKSAASEKRSKLPDIKKSYSWDTENVPPSYLSSRRNDKYNLKSSRYKNVSKSSSNSHSDRKKNTGKFLKQILDEESQFRNRRPSGIERLDLEALEISDLNSDKLNRIPIDSSTPRDNSPFKSLTELGSYQILQKQNSIPISSSSSFRGSVPLKYNGSSEFVSCKGSAPNNKNSSNSHIHQTALTKSVILDGLNAAKIDQSFYVPKFTLTFYESETGSQSDDEIFSKSTMDVLELVQNSDSDFRNEALNHLSSMQTLLLNKN